MANIANLITKLSGIIASLDDIRDAISQGGGGSSTASGVSVTPTSPLTGTNLQATTNETAALLQEHTDDISSLNSSMQTQEISPSATTSACIFIKIVKCGKLVSIYARADIATANTQTEIATLPSSIAPSANYANTSGVISTFTFDGPYTNFGLVSIDLSTNKVTITGNTTGMFTGLIQYLTD